MSELVKTNYTQEDMLDRQEVKVLFPDEDFGVWCEVVSKQYTNNRLTWVEVLDDDEILMVPVRMIKAVR